MTLYELTNGYIGESYVRVYAWAHSAEEAITLARPKFEARGKRERHDDYAANLTATVLFSADDAPFATEASDEGWER